MVSQHRESPGSFVRAMTFVVLITTTLLAGMVFTTQTNAYAYQATAKAVSLLPSAAKTLATATPWGRGIMTAIQIASLFNGLGFIPSFKPGVTANDDQVSTGPSNSGCFGGLNVACPTNPAQTITFTGNYNYTVNILSAPKERGGIPASHGFSFTVTKNAASSRALTRVETFCRVGSNSGQFIKTFADPAVGQTITVNVTTAEVCNGIAPSTVATDGPDYAFFTQAGNPSSGLTFYNFGPTGTIEGQAPGDPQRRARSYSDCAPTYAAGATTIRVYSAWILYKDSTGFPEIVPPPCPAGSPARVGFGAESEILDTGTGVFGNRTNIVPPIVRPANPVGYPDIVPGDTVEALPQPRPGGRTNADGTTATEPTPDSQGNYCTYGKYNIDPAECNDAVVPVPGPTTTVVVTPTPGTIGTAPDTGTSSDLCALSFSFNPIDWVIQPLRCLFIPPAGTITGWQTRTSTRFSTPPFSSVREVSTFFGDVQTDLTAGGCNSATIVPIGGTTTNFDPICAIGVQVQTTTLGQRIYSIFQVAAYIALGWYLWVRIFKSVGSKEEDKV